MCGRHVAGAPPFHLSTGMTRVSSSCELSFVYSSSAKRSAQSALSRSNTGLTEGTTNAASCTLSNADPTYLLSASSRSNQARLPLSQDGAAAVAVWIVGQSVLVGNVGDAKCVLARASAQVRSAS